VKKGRKDSEGRKKERKKGRKEGRKKGLKERKEGGKGKGREKGREREKERKDGRKEGTAVSGVKRPLHGGFGSETAKILTATCLTNIPQRMRESVRV
jgi:hypothetical protein